jgi:hypothetical protein
MRRQVALVLSTSVIAAPIPVALAQTGTDDIDALVGVPTLAERQELRQEARAAKQAAEQRRAEKREARQAAAVPAIPPHLAAIAQCESGGDPTAVSADGTYRGMFQFDYGTWASVGGTGDPAAASVAEQVKRAEILYSRAGSSPWPVCG